jgi:hypothetical protein
MEKATSTLNIMTKTVKQGADSWGVKNIFIFTKSLERKYKIDTELELT